MPYQNSLVIEYKSLVDQYPHEYSHLKQAFNILFEVILDLLIQDKPIEKLIQQSERMNEEQWINQFFVELNKLKSSGEYHGTVLTLGFADK